MRNIIWKELGCANANKTTQEIKEKWLKPPAKAFGDRDDIADAIFTMKSVTIAGETVPGLGLNIVRYNQVRKKADRIFNATFFHNLSHYKLHAARWIK